MNIRGLEITRTDAAYYSRITRYENACIDLHHLLHVLPPYVFSDLRQRERERERERCTKISYLSHAPCSNVAAVRFEFSGSRDSAHRCCALFSESDPHYPYVLTMALESERERERHTIYRTSLSYTRFKHCRYPGAIWPWGDKRVADRFLQRVTCHPGTPSTCSQGPFRLQWCRVAVPTTTSRRPPHPPPPRLRCGSLRPASPPRHALVQNRPIMPTVTPMDFLCFSHENHTKYHTNRTTLTQAISIPYVKVVRFTRHV